MKKRLIKEWRLKNTEELNKILLTQREDLVRIMIDLKSKKLRNTALVGNRKKTISVISTIINEKESVKI